MPKENTGASTQTSEEVNAQVGIEVIQEQATEVKLRKPKQRTIVAEVVAYKEVEKRGNMSNDAAFVSVTTIGEYSETFTIPINLEFVNVAELPKILFEGNAVSLVVEEHIAGVTTYVDKDKVVKVHKEPSPCAFVTAVHATTMQLAMGLQSLAPAMQSAILNQYANVRANHNAEIVSKSSAGMRTFGE